MKTKNVLEKNCVVWFACVKFLYWAVSLNGTSCCNGIVAVVIIIGCCKRIYMHHIHKRNLELMNLFFDDDMYWIQDFGFVTTNLLLFMWKQNLKNTPNACVWFFFQFQLFWNRNKAFWHIYARRMITEVVIPPSYRLALCFDEFSRQAYITYKFFIAKIGAIME